MTRSVVVLPDPDGPSMVKNSPAAMSRSTPSTATTSPYARRIPERRTAGAVAGSSCSALRRACVAKRFLENREPAVELVVGRRQRRQQTDDVAVEAAGEKDETALPRARDDALRGGGASLGELEREHRAQPANLADDRAAGGDLVQSLAQERGDLLGPLPEARRGELVEHRRCCGARDGISAERAPKAARMHRVHDRSRAGHRGERQPAAQRLAGDDEIGLDVETLDCPDRPRPAATGLDFVVDVEDAVSFAALLQRAHELGGHGNEAALALDRLEHHARDLARVDVLLEQEVEARECVLRRHAAIRIRCGRAIDGGRKRAEALLVDELRRHRHRQRRAAVEGAVEDDDAGPAGRGARDLHSVLDRLCAGVDEDGLRRRVAGPELVEPAADLDVRLVHADHEALVEVSVDLLVDGADDPGRAVPEVLAGDAAGEVQVLAAVGVPDAGAPRPGDDEVGGGYPA